MDRYLRMDVSKRFLESLLRGEDIPLFSKYLHSSQATRLKINNSGSLLPSDNVLVIDR